MLKRVSGYLMIDDGADAPEASHQLEQEGYCVLRGVLNQEEIDALKHSINKVFDEVPRDNRAEQNRSASEDEHFRYEMLNRSEVCQTTIAHPVIRETLKPLLGRDFHIIANTAWRNPANKTGKHAGQAWHIDAGPHVPLPDGVSWPDNIPHPIFAVGSHIFLQDCHLEDGPTGVIPGSHLSGQFPPWDAVDNDDLQYQGVGVKPLLAKAGDIAMFVSDIWHRRMPTQDGDQGRFFLQAHYGRRDIAQRLRTTLQVNQLSDSAIERATNVKEKAVIGIHNPQFYDG